jgi:hypothetical protein
MALGIQMAQRFSLALCLLLASCSHYQPGPDVRFRVQDRSTLRPINAVAVLVTGYGAAHLMYSNGEGLTPTVQLDRDLPFNIAATADGYQPYAELNLPAPSSPATLLVEMSR